MKNWMKILMLTAVSFSFAAASYAQCHTVAITNFTGLTLEVGGESVFWDNCPPAGAPEDHGPFVSVPFSTTTFSAGAGKRIYRVGGQEMADPMNFGYAMYPSWVPDDCIFELGDLTVVWVSESGGYCKTEIW